MLSKLHFFGERLGVAGSISEDMNIGKGTAERASSSLPKNILCEHPR